MISLIVIAGGDSEDVGRAFIRGEDDLQAFQVFVVSEVFDPVEAAGGRGGDVPLDGGVTLPVGALQPVKPADMHQISHFIHTVSTR